MKPGSAKEQRHRRTSRARDRGSTRARHGPGHPTAVAPLPEIVPTEAGRPKLFGGFLAPLRASGTAASSSSDFRSSAGRPRAEKTRRGLGSVSGAGARSLRPRRGG
jgi:hypothetical protein